MALIRLYDYPASGNCYKVRLLLTQLGVPFERVHLDVIHGEARTPAYAEKNANQRVPLIEWPDGRRLPESNAILWHFAEGTPFLPDDRWERVWVLQWMFFEQNNHETSIAVVRFWHIAGLLEEKRHDLTDRTRRGYEALGVMERRLATHSYLVGDRYTIADIALYAYTHIAGEGGFDLSRFPGIDTWMKRVRSQPGHILITDPVGRLAVWP